MTVTQREIAEAFSGHRFDLAFPHLADDIRWNLVGAPPMLGRAAVIAACEQSAAELADVTTTFDRFKVVADDDTVVVDSIGRYVEPAGGEAVVSSCDIYEFAGHALVAITTYAVELDGSSA